MARKVHVRFKPTAIRRSKISSLLDGRWWTDKRILSQYPMYLLGVLLAFMYIGMQNNAETLAIQKRNLQNEVVLLRAESVALATELMQMSKPTEVRKMVRAHNINLRESSKPPMKIIVERKKQLP